MRENLTSGSRWQGLETDAAMAVELSTTGKPAWNKRHRLRLAPRQPLTLHMWAFCSLRASPGCRAYYRRRRAIGDGHHQALRALGNRLVGYLHGGLRARRLYDEATARGSRSDGDTELAA